MKNQQEILLKAKRICIFRTDGIGDMILTLPMVNIIKEINPDVEIHIIIAEKTSPLLENQPLIKKFYFIENIVKLPCFLKDRKFDIIFFPRPKPKEVIASFIARVPLRVGSAYRYYSFLLNHRVKEHRKYGKKSEAQHNVNLISSITGENYKISLIPPVVHNELLSQIATKYKLPSNYIIIHPGGAGSAPKLPIKKFIELSKIINEKYLKQIILTGNETEFEFTHSISEAVPSAINLCGKTTLNELIAIISNSEGIVANSTGVIHIAASFNKKIIGFYPNSPNMNSTRWGPISDKKIILTPPNNGLREIDNMELISNEDIEKSFVELFIS